MSPRSVKDKNGSKKMIRKSKFLVVIGFLIFSCSTSEESNMLPDDDEIPNSSSRLSKITTSNDGSSFVIDFIYEGENLISLSVNSGESEERLIYDNNLPIKIERYSNGSLTSFSDLEYENGVFKRERSFDNGVNISYTDYSFQNQNLIKVERFTENENGEFISTFRREFDYDINGNVELVTQMELIASNNQITEFSYKYDINQHYMSGLTKEVRFFFWDDFISISNNNFISETIKTNGQTISEDTFEYTYNSDGLPLNREEFNSDGQSISTTAYSYE